MRDWDTTMQAAADELHKRQPHNPFFQWLSVGSSDALVDEIAAQLPATGNHTKRQWSFCREDSQRAFTESMGWEYVALANWMLSGV